LTHNGSNDAVSPKAIYLSGSQCQKSSLKGLLITPKIPIGLAGSQKHIFMKDQKDQPKNIRHISYNAACDKREYCLRKGVEKARQVIQIFKNPSRGIKTNEPMSSLNQELTDKHFEKRKLRHSATPTGQSEIQLPNDEHLFQGT
jgi:hypothetical protein